MAQLRAFVAVEPPASLIPAYQAARRFLSDLDARLRWVRPEGMHLTLKFLGNVDVASVPVILKALQAVAGQTPAMALHTTGIGAPNPGRARVVWLEVGGETAILDRLQANVDNAMLRIGFEREERRFHPHLTIARARKSAVRLPSELTGPIPSVRFVVDRLSLYSSELRPDGAVYNALGHARLSGPSARG